MVDFSKPLKTRDGSSVRLLWKDRVDDVHPILALVTTSDGAEEVASFTVAGRFSSFGLDHRLDLVNVPEETVEFVNLYQDADGESRAYTYDSLGLARVGFTGVAIFKVTKVDGKVTKVELA